MRWSAALASIADRDRDGAGRSAGAAVAAWTFALALAGLGARVGLRALERSSSGWFLPPQEEMTHGHRPGSSTVLVLGHADTGTTAGAENLARARAAVAVVRPGDVLVCSGGGVAGPVPEARLLADAAREGGLQF